MRRAVTSGNGPAGRSPASRLGPGPAGELVRTLIEAWSAASPERDDHAAETVPEYQGEVGLQLYALVPVLAGGHPIRRFLADHPDPLVGEHQRLGEREGLVVAPERARLLRRHRHREVADLGEVLRVAQPGLAVERAEEQDPVAGPRVRRHEAGRAAEVIRAPASRAAPASPYRTYRST